MIQALQQIIIQRLQLPEKTHEIRILEIYINDVGMHFLGESIHLGFTANFIGILAHDESHCEIKEFAYQSSPRLSLIDQEFRDVTRNSTEITMIHLLSDALGSVIKLPEEPQRITITKAVLKQGTLFYQGEAKGWGYTADFVGRISVASPIISYSVRPSRMKYDIEESWVQISRDE